MIKIINKIMIPKQIVMIIVSSYHIPSVVGLAKNYPGKIVNTLKNANKKLPNN